MNTPATLGLKPDFLLGPNAALEAPLFHGTGGDVLDTALQAPLVRVTCEHLVFCSGT